MRVIWRLLTYVKYQWQLFVGAFLVYMTASFLQQWTPTIIQKIIDTQLTPLSQGGGIVDMAYVFKQLSLFIGVTIVLSIGAYISSIWFMRVANRIVEHLRNEAFDTMQRLPISYFDDKPAGKISTRIVNDTETLRKQFYGGLLTQILTLFLQIVMIYIMIFSVNIWTGFALLFMIPIIIIWQKIYSRASEKSLSVYYEAQSEINSQVNETIHGSEQIQLMQLEEDFRGQFGQTIERMRQADMKNLHAEVFLSFSLAELFKRFFVFLIIAIAGYQYIGKNLMITAGEIFLIINYTERLFNNLNMIVRQFPQLQRSLTTGQRVLELLDEPRESDGVDTLVVSDGNVTFDHVSFGYVDNHFVLKDIHIEAKQGEVIALVGHTGSGKSSIINLLMRFYDPQQGRIMIDGQDIGECQRESVRQEMGIVLQDPYLFTGTIASNIRMGNVSMTDEQVRQALVKVGAQPLIDKLPKGIDEPVFEKGATYSSGERQLISFARTLAADPKILILDEATSHIDTETEELIQHAMKVVQEGRTTFIVAHRLSTIQHANQILVLHEGEIVERGTHSDLLRQEGQYAKMYQMQLRLEGNV